jgi:ATP-dependent DNA helicase PIF1
MQPQELSLEQEKSLDLFMKGENIFLTGPGGSGKSFLIKKMIELSRERKKVVTVCALTGCAALLLDCSATTIHSWSGINYVSPVQTDESIIRRVSSKKYIKKSWKEVDVLIVDEISMLSGRLFCLLNSIGKLIRKKSSPFGGIQVIFLGDFFQLPPIGDAEDGQFCFESDDWLSVFPLENHVVLKKIFRQNDSQYVDILQEVRFGKLSKKSIETLNEYVGRDKDMSTVITKIFPIRKRVAYINKEMFEKLKTPIVKCELSIHTDMQTIKEVIIPDTVLEKCRMLTTLEIEHEVESLIKLHSLEPLELKLGAFVMCTKNVCLDKKICNGSQGVITNFIDGRPQVTFSNGVLMTMREEMYQSETYPTIAIGQVPLCLAWAITIHKIQGTTLEREQIDVGETIFEYGQTYVALSRVKSLDGLYLLNFNPSKIKANPKVVSFYTMLEMTNTLSDCRLES